VVDAVDHVLKRGRGAAGAASGGCVLLEALASPFAAGLIEKEGSGWCARARGKERNPSQAPISPGSVEIGVAHRWYLRKSARNFAAAWRRFCGRSEGKERGGRGDL
jgi:hypothetical protein